MRWPVLVVDRGRYRQYGWSTSNGAKHVGHDYDCPLNTAVYAISAGTVIFSDQANGFGGLNPSKPGGLIMIQHETAAGVRFVALYGHITRFIYTGEEVGEGTIVGRIAPFTNSYTQNGERVTYSAPHLHFGIHLGEGIPAGRWGYTTDTAGWVDPRSFIQNNGFGV